MTFRHHKKHSTHCCVTFTMVKRKCHQKIPCIYSKHLVSMVSHESTFRHLQWNHKFQLAINSVSGLTNNRLQAFCKHNLEHNIHVQNVLQILEASDKMNVPDIKKYALSMIVRDYSQVARLPKINDLSRELLLEIIEAMADVLAEIRIGHFPSISVHSDI